MPTRTRALPATTKWGTTLNPARTNLQYYGDVPGRRQLLTNTPFAWELLQTGPMAWTADIADDGNPPAWWIGEAREGPWPIGPHGPWVVGAFAAIPVVNFLTKLVADPLTRFRVVDPTAPREHFDLPVWLRDPQLLRPDDRVGPSPIPYLERLPAATFWRDWVVSALWYGRGLIYYLEDEQGQPRAGTLRHLNPSLVKRDDDGRWWIGDDWYTDPDGAWTFLRDDGRLGRGRIIALRNPDNPWGVFAAYPDTFTITRKMARYLDRLYTSGVPSGVLKVTAPGLTQDQANGLKKAWMDAHGGVGRSVAVLNATTDYQPIQITPVDGATSDMKRVNYADIAFAFGVPPALIGTSVMAGGGVMTYTNLQALWEEREDIVLPSWLAAVEQTLSSLLPGTREVKVDLDQYRYGTLDQRITDYSNGVAAGLDPGLLADQLDLPYTGRSSA